LAYVIYYDNKNKLRKETSWEFWRVNKIDPLEIDNAPTEGFVLNKKVGGYKYDWNVRNTYVRIYDPRDFEFEISVPNLLYILENTSSIKGKGLEGEFVYGWSGTELLLISTCSPDYSEIQRINALKFSNKKVKASDLISGATYRHRTNTELIYMGRFNKYGNGSRYSINWENRGKHYFFIEKPIKVEYLYHNIKTLKSLGDSIVEVIDSNCIQNYADIFELLEKEPVYSPIDPSKDQYVKYSFEYFKKNVIGHYNSFYSLVNGNYIEMRMYSKSNIFYGYHICRSYDKSSYKDVEEVFKKLQPSYKKQFLVNGKFYNSTKI
jgi:hypothetical protein